MLKGVYILSTNKSCHPDVYFNDISKVKIENLGIDTNDLLDITENRSSGFLTMSDAKRPVQSQTKAKKLEMMTHCAICVSKRKALISCAVTAQLISVFVFALANIRLSHDAAHMTSKMTSSLPAMWPSD